MCKTLVKTCQTGTFFLPIGNIDVYFAFSECYQTISCYSLVITQKGGISPKEICPGYDIFSRLGGLLSAKEDEP